GAAGPTNIVVLTNVDIGVYNKTNCATVSRVGLTSFFGPLGVAPNETLFDIQALFDPAVGRFFVSAESCVGSCNQTSVDQFEYFAVSQDSSGTSWFLYRLTIHQGATIFCVSATTTFWDYPHAGWVNGSNPRWFFTANLFPAAGGSTGAIMSVNKTPTLT